MDTLPSPANLTSDPPILPFVWLNPVSTPTLTERVVNAIRGLTRLVVAVSGGPDSVCLLHALAQAPKLQLTVACLDHGLRAEARAEVRTVRALARKLKAGFVTDRVDTRAWAKANRRSLEEAARQLRYSFLQRAMRAVQAEAVAVAHTEDDQAETVLLHLLRGSGLDGLAGMAVETSLEIDGQRLPVIRPLLSVTRAEVEAYCRAQRLPVARDASNDDLAFTRNRIRHRLLPVLARYNPKIRPALARLAELTQGDVALLQGLVDDALQGVRLGLDRVLIPWPTWMNWPDALRRRAIRASVVRVSHEPVELESAPLKAALAALARSQTGARFDLGSGWCLERERSGVVVARQTGTQPAPSTLEIKAGVWSLKTIRANPDRWVAYVDADAVRAAMRAAGLRGPWSAGLRLRHWQAGDRLQPLGLDGRSTKLSDLFGNAGVSRTERRTWPIVVVGEAIVWVAGLRLDQRFAAQAGRRMLRLTIT